MATLRTAFALVLLAAPPAAAQEMIGVTWDGMFHRFDSTTGSITFSAPTGHARHNGSVLLDDGRFIASLDGSSSVTEIDPLTGAGSVSIQVGQDLRGLAQQPGTGTVFGMTNGGDLFTVDVTNGSSSLVGSSGLSSVQALEFTPDGTLWTYVVNINGSQHGLHRIDPASGADLQHLPDPGGVDRGLQWLTADASGRLFAGRGEVFEIDLATGAETQLAQIAGDPDLRGADLVASTVGDNYCGPAVANSTGLGAVVSAVGSEVVANDDFTLRCAQMPTNSFGYFLNSRTQGFVANPGGSQGNLCLSGSVGRFNLLVQNSGAAGEIEIPVDLAAMPQPNGPVAVLPGETWNFTCWFRDANPMVTSNFSDGLEVTFQ